MVPAVMFRSSWSSQSSGEDLDNSTHQYMIAKDSKPSEGETDCGMCDRKESIRKIIHDDTKAKQELTGEPGLSRTCWERKELCKGAMADGVQQDKEIKCDWDEWLMSAHHLGPWRMHTVRQRTSAQLDKLWTTYITQEWQRWLILMQNSASE